MHTPTKKILGNIRVDPFLGRTALFNTEADTKVPAKVE
jgi:hypothetical protein